MIADTTQALVFGVLAGALVMAVVLLVRRPQAPGVWMSELTRGMPQHADLGRVYERLSVVETAVAGLRGEMTGFSAAVGRMERLLGTVVESHLRKED